jgi:hypothetical protein
MIRDPPTGDLNGTGDMKRGGGQMTKQAPEAENDARKTLSVEGSLYEQIREYCDDNGLRLVAFVEEALENAMDMKEEVKYLEEAESLISEVQDEKERAYRRGYRVGLLAAFFAAQGRLGTSMSYRAQERELKEGRFRAVEGDGQLTLFR